MSESQSVQKPQPIMTPGAEHYWQSATQESFVLPQCGDCDAVFFYPRLWCPQCFSQNLDWFQASGRGRVYSFSVVHQAPFPAFQGDVPYVLALVALEEGPHMMSNVLNCDPDSVYVDMPLTVTFETRGALKIPQFQPAT